jgi:hypothetical protein
MQKNVTNPTEAPPDGASCDVHPNARAGARPSIDAGLLSGGCCSEGGAIELQASMGRAARRSRATAGLAFLAIGGVLGSRRLPGRIALWPASIVPTWFGISHLVAGVTGYEGCPELGAIPSVMLGRPVGSSCELWQRIDKWIDRSGSTTTPCC